MTNIRNPKIEYITLEQYQSYTENPSQRETVARAERVKKGHLKAWQPQHCLIQVAELPSGKRYLLDGHTRRRLIETGHFTQAVLPNNFCAFIIPAKNSDHVRELYRSCDSRQAVESPGELKFGAMRYHNKYQLKSKRYKGGGGLGYVDMLCAGTWTAKEKDDVIAKCWGEEIRKLDEMDIPQGNSVGGVTVLPAATNNCILQLIGRGYTDQVKDFVLAIQKNAGESSNGLSDGVRLYIDAMTRAKAKNIKTSSGGGVPVVENLFIPAFHMYINNQRKKTLPKLNNRLIKKYKLQKQYN